MAMTASEIQAKFTADISDFSAKLDIISAQISKVKTTTNSMSTSVFKGVASWDLLKKAVNITTGFLKDSVEASMEAQKQMAFVRQNVENSGVAYDSVKDKIEEYSKSMLKMGFDDEETALSVSKLMLVTGDYTQALKLNHLAADVARNKGIGLAEATKMVTLVASGNVKALREYDIELKKGASSAENLAIMQEKVKGSMETFANTTEGKLQIMKVTFGDLKEQIGDTFGPALNIALTNFNNFLNVSMGNAKVWGDSLAEKLAILVNPDTWKLTGKVVKTGVEQIGYNIKNSFLGSAAINAVSQFSGLTQALNLANKAFSVYNSLTGKKKETISPIDKQKQSIIDLAMKIKDTTDVALKLQTALDLEKATDFAGIGKEGADTLQKELQKLREELTKFATGIEDVSKKHSEAIDSMKDDINSLNKDYAQSGIDAKNSHLDSVASIVRQHQDKVTELKRQLMEETAFGQEINEAKVAQIRSELAKEMDFLNKHASDVAGVTDLLEEDELDKENKKYAEEESKRKTAYEKQLADLNSQLAKENDAYNRSLAKMAIDFSGNWDNIISFIKNSATPSIVDAFKIMVNQANLELSKIGLPKLDVKVPTLSVPGVKQYSTGGMITETGIHLLHAGEQVISRSQVEAGKGSPSNISVNFYGEMNISKEADENRLAIKIRNVLMDDMHLAQSGLY